MIPVINLDRNASQGDRLMAPPVRIYVWAVILVAFIVPIEGRSESTTPASASGPITEIRRLDHFALHVTDLERSAAFYEKVFGFQMINKWKTTWMVGNDYIRIGLFLRKDATKIDDPDNRIIIEHVAFLTDERGFESAVSKLTVLGIKHDPPEDTGIAKSVFFRDPDDHLLEITYYYAKAPKP